ncbi:MAG TPA: PilZ domain-containing protein [Bdellovibrionales bacterium]|nr:PilZ domain-containing protein [Bdellovibrionales bacterium]
MISENSILLITEPELSTQTRWVRAQLDQHAPFRISETSRDRMKESTLLIEQKFSTIIFICYKLGPEELTFLRKVSSEANQTPVLILTSQISIPTYSLIHSMDNIVALQSPCEPAVFISVLEKAMVKQSVGFKVCPRFITNEPVRVVVMKTGLFIPTKMRNYSATGAFLEYRGISVKVGDKIRLNLGSESAKRDEQLTVEAKVIWIRQGENARSPARGVGVQFNWIDAVPIATP